MKCSLIWVKIVINILIFIAAISCNSFRDKKCNVKIVNKEFLVLLRDFEITASDFVKKKNNLISVSVSVKNSDTIVNLYAYTTLNPEYYIGCSYNDSTKIYLYSNIKQGIEGFYEVFSETEIHLDKPAGNDPPFMIGYKYINGQFVSESLPAL